MKAIIDKDLIDSTMRSMEIPSLDHASIRQLGAIVHTLEKSTGVEFIHFEIGVPGLSPSRVGVEAHKRAIDEGVSAVYPPIEGVAELKAETARFVKAFIGTDISPEGCIPTVGSMQGAFASIMICSALTPEKDTILYLDPGFSVQKTQADVLGVRKESFDIFNYRAEKLGPKLEEILSDGRIAAILYSNPNNPTWMCLSDDELRTIGTLATRYDAVVIEDLAYVTMDFRRDLGHPYREPYQVTVTRYTDNYIVLLSASKIFSYAGERIAVACISDKLFNRHYDNLHERFGLARFGSVFVHRLIYTLSSGVSHSAQKALAAMFRAASDGTYDFVAEIREYADRTARLKEILLRNGFNIVYDKDIDQPVGDGFFFTIGYRGMSGAELLRELLSYGVSGIVLSTTGAVYEGIRACSSAIKPRHYAMLAERLAMFDADHRAR